MKFKFSALRIGNLLSTFLNCIGQKSTELVMQTFVKQCMQLLVVCMTGMVIAL